MKHCKLIILATVLTLGLAGCTQNRGYIGELFGSWVLDEMTADGNVLPMSWGEYTTLSFQGTVVRFSLHHDLHNYISRLCTWTRSDNLLRFDFTNGGHEVDNDGMFALPYWLYYTDDIITFTIAELDNGHMTLVCNGSDGKLYMYKYLRTW